MHFFSSFFCFLSFNLSKREWCGPAQNNLSFWMHVWRLNGQSSSNSAHKVGPLPWDFASCINEIREVGIMQSSVHRSCSTVPYAHFTPLQVTLCSGIMTWQPWHFIRVKLYQTASILWTQGLFYSSSFFPLLFFLLKKMPLQLSK